MFTVALTDDALRPAPRQYYTPRRLLQLEVIHDNPEAARESGTRVLTEIVPLLTKDGEPLPDIDDQGHVQYVSTPLTPDDFVDLPRPVQALQLCTVLLEAADFRLAATEVDISDTGECTLSTEQGRVVVSTEYTSGHLDTYSDRIAGRPAWRPSDTRTVEVWLRDDAKVVLEVSAPDSVALAEKLVPLLT